VVYPGKVWTVDDPNDVLPFPPLNFPQQEVNSLINYLNGLLERRTSVSETTLGVATRGKTATEAHILQEASLTPFATRTDLFARSFLAPLGKIALAMLQQFLLEDQTITVRDFNGVDVSLVVTANEIQAGRYRVVATLTRQDSTRLAKAQSIERVLPTLAQFQPILAQEGVQISFSEILKRYLDLIGVDGVERVLTRMDPRSAQSPERVAALRARGKNGPGESRMNPGRGPAGPIAPDSPTRLVEDGGPLGPEPSDQNALAQFLQLQAAGALGRAG